jgi:hypothetical protein
MTDDDQLYQDLAERHTSVINAISDVEGIEIDAANDIWDDGTVENAASAAVGELEALLAAIQERMKSIPPPEVGS